MALPEQRTSVVETRQVPTAAVRPQRPNLRREAAFREWVRRQPRDSRTVHLLENGFVFEASSSDDGIPSEVLRAAADVYAESGWLGPAARAYTLAGDRQSALRIAVQWLDDGLLEEAALALEEAALPFTDALLDRYVEACQRNGWLLHTAAQERLAARAAVPG